MDILIIHDNIPNCAAPDVLDVITQVEAVQNALKELGHTSTSQSIPKDLKELEKQLIIKRPSLLVNLVETIDGSGKFAYKVPELLEKLNIPFTGTKSRAMLTTTDKILSKAILRKNGVLTPQEITLQTSSENEICEPGTYILKPVCEDASVGVDEDSVVFIADREDFMKKVKTLSGEASTDWFAELYIDGREWNVGVLGTNTSFEVLPPAEIRFINYDNGKPKVLGYKAKWMPDSFEYVNTTRHFDFSPNDADLIAQLESIATHCWSLFDLTGYARVDFRVDSKGVPYVLEINANPCLSPDAGLVAAASHKGINYAVLVKKILDAALKQ